MRGHIVKRYKKSYTIVLNLGIDSATGKRKQQWLSVKGLHEYVLNLLRQTQQRQGWTKLVSSTTELRRKETQLELRRVAREIDTALISIELMRAFPGRCSLCPV